MRERNEEEGRGIDTKYRTDMRCTEVDREGNMSGPRVALRCEVARVATRALRCEGRGRSHAMRDDDDKGGDDAAG